MIEYGVRSYGGHIEARVSRHMAVREVEQRIAAGERNVWLVARRVTDWSPSLTPAPPACNLAEQVDPRA